MKRLYLFVVVMFWGFLLSAQSSAVITIKNLKNETGKIFITYDITNAKASEVFDISVIAKLKNGTTLDAKTVSGDLQNIKDGVDKQIVWSYQTDNIYLNENVDIQLQADFKKEIKTYSNQQLYIMTTFLPGRGVSIIKQNNMYIPLTALGYGTLLTGLSTYFMAKNYYSQYSLETNPDVRTILFTKTKSFSTISLITGVSALAVWGFNYFNLYTTLSQNNKKTSFNFYPNYDYFTKSGLVSFGLRF